jgi:hypothetical protein
MVRAPENPIRHSQGMVENRRQRAIIRRSSSTQVGSARVAGGFGRPQSRPFFVGVIGRGPSEAQLVGVT